MDVEVVDELKKKENPEHGKAFLPSTSICMPRDSSDSFTSTVSHLMDEDECALHRRVGLKLFSSLREILLNGSNRNTARLVHRPAKRK